MRFHESPLAQREPLSVVYRRPADLRRYGKNARTHPEAQVRQIAASMRTFGFNNPVLLKDDGETIGAGHGRLDAAELMLAAGERLPTPDGETIPTITLHGLTDAQWRAFVLADNRLAENAGWDEALLAEELADLQLVDPDLPVLAGFDGEELAGLLAMDDPVPPSEPPPDDADDADEPKRGDLLELVNITIAEPRHRTAQGERWSLGGRHILVVGKVMTEWATWAPLLPQHPNAIFCPYPGPFIAFGPKAAEHTLILVQPDLYTAGHILDRYEEAHGAGSVVRVSP